MPRTSWSVPNVAGPPGSGNVAWSACNGSHRQVEVSETGLPDALECVPIASEFHRSGLAR